MPTTFVIRNQEGQYLTKKSEWVSGKEAAGLYFQPHHDQALNQLIEMNSKDIYLRGTVVELEVCAKRRPVVVEYGPDPEQPELLEEALAEDGEASAADGSSLEASGSELSEEKEEYTGFIRPLNVEPRMPRKAVVAEETAE